MLWWPRRGQWKYAFFVRRTARGLRFHRELHAVLGIWVFLVFMAVSFSGVVLAWPQTMGAQPPGFNPRALPRVEPAKARAASAPTAPSLWPGALPARRRARLTLPARHDQPVTVNL